MKNDVVDISKETKRVSSVIKGEVKVNKKTGAKRFLNLLVDDNIGDVKEWILIDVIVPVIKDTIVEIINGTSEMIFHGKVNRRGGRSYRAETVTKTNYNGISTSSGKASSSSLVRGVTASPFFSSDAFIFETRADAEIVRDTLLELVDVFGQASVADFYDACGKSHPNGFTDTYYGWTDISRSYISRTRGGWVINMPMCIDIKVK